MLEPSGPSARTESAPPCASLRFTSFYLYSPRAVGRVAQESRILCLRVKRGDAVWLPRYAGQVYRTSFRDPQLAAVFTPNSVLVPVPGSAVTGTAPWSALQLAKALKDVGFGLPVRQALRRQVAVTKSSTAAIAARPSVRDHYDSFCVVASMMGVQRVVLIDDVVTKGRTLLAAAARLGELFPHTDVRAFALIRTLGFAWHMDHLAEPSHGFIRWAGRDARREP